jgi:hypothetical protein
MRSLALYNWISSNQPGANCEFAHGWWESAEFLQLLSSDFESFDFGVLTSYSMETPPPSSFVTMPVVSALAPNLEIYFKESWVVEPNYTVSVKWLLPVPLSSLICCSLLMAGIDGCCGISRLIICMSRFAKELPLSRDPSKISIFCTRYFISLPPRHPRRLTREMVFANIIAPTCCKF